MPLTPFQRGVAQILAKHRSPEDLDIFHDLGAIVAASAEADAKVLRETGYSVEWTLRGEAIFKAVVTRGEDRLRLDWTVDSAFRFFPAVPDEEFGYCLHQADLATNKVLALAGRSEVRDFLDTLLIDRTYLSLGAVIWAACGKDQGYTSALLLDQTNRHSRYQESDLKGENLARPVDLRELKQQWLGAHARAEQLFEQLPAEELGCLYLDADSKPVTPDPADANLPG